MKHEALDILRTFSKDELNKFKLFVVSPYFTRKKNLGKFLKMLIKFHPEYNVDELTDEYLQPQFGYAGSSTVRNYFSDLKQLLLKYIMYLNIEKTSHEQYIVTLEELEDRNLIEQYNQKKIEYLSFINNSTRNFQTTDYLNLYRFNLAEKNLLLGNMHIKKGSHKMIAEYEMNSGNLLTKYYLFESLKDWVQTKIHKNHFNLNNLKKNNYLNAFFQEGKLLEELFESMIEDETDYERKKILKTYYLVYQCFKENQKVSELYQNLEKLHKAITFLPNCINDFEYQYLISVSRNAYSELRRRNVHERILKNKFDETYLKTFLRKGGDFKIPNYVFSMILFEALIDDELKFAQMIFKKYRKYTNNELYEFYENAICFYECLKLKKFTEASTTFLKLKTTDINLKRKLKMLQIYLHYEKGDFDYCIDLLENFKKFIHNHRFEHSKIFVEKLFRICNYIKLFCSIKLKFDKKKIMELQMSNDFPSTIFLRKKREEILKEFCKKQ